MVADILHATGSMPGAHLVEADRSMIVGEWLGSTALKTRAVAEAALGGVLFLDEAHALAGDPHSSADKFAYEALDTLVKIMEDDREDLVVILAGYPEEVTHLLDMNPELRSRIARYVHFPDYTGAELSQITTQMAVGAGYTIAPALQILRAHLTAHATASDGGGGGNARYARTLLEACIAAHAARLSENVNRFGATPTTDELMTIGPDDAQAGITRLSHHA